MDSNVRLGLVGISGYGESYLKSLLPDSRGLPATLVAGADPNFSHCQRLDELKQRGVAIYASAEEMFAKEKLDLAIIVSPIQYHAQHTRLALQAGANVLCEKPLAGSLREAQQMLADSKAYGKFVAIGYQWSFSEAVQSLKRDINSGALGKPLRLRTYVVYPRGFEYYARNSWAGKLRTTSGMPVLDSPVNNATAHFLHNMFYLLGSTPSQSAMPETVQAELYRANAIENYDNAALRCKMPADVEVLFYTAHSTPKRVGPRCVFEFTDAVVEYDGLHDREFVAKFHNGKTKGYGDPHKDSSNKLSQAIRATKSGSEILCDVASALPHTCSVVAAQQSVPISQFPADLVSDDDGDEGPMLVVNGLHHVMQRAFEKGVLPSELGGVPWAKAGKPVSIQSLQDLG